MTPLAGTLALGFSTHIPPRSLIPQGQLGSLPSPNLGIWRRTESRAGWACLGFRGVQTPPPPLDVTVHLGLPGPYTDLYLGTPFGVAGWSPNPLPLSPVSPLSYNQAHPPGHREPPKSPPINTALGSVLCSPALSRPIRGLHSWLQSAHRCLGQPECTPRQPHPRHMLSLSCLGLAFWSLPGAPRLHPHSLFPMATWIKCGGVQLPEGVQEAPLLPLVLVRSLRSLRGFL